MQREGKEGFSSSQPEGQRIPLGTSQRNEGQQRRGGWAPGQESGDPGFWKSFRDFGQISKHVWACSFSCELEGLDSDVQIVLTFYPPLSTQKG